MCRDFLLPKLPAMKPELQQGLAAGMLRELQELASQDSSFLQLLASTPLVPTESRDLCMPGQIYDPRQAAVHNSDSSDKAW